MPCRSAPRGRAIRYWSWSDRHNVVETDVEIGVPAHTNLDVTSFSSPITVTGVEGSHHVRTCSSTLTLDDVAGPTNHASLPVHQLIVWHRRFPLVNNTPRERKRRRPFTVS